MLSVFLKYKKMVLCGFLFFYLGCVLTLSFIRMDCVSGATNSIKSRGLVNKFNKCEYVCLVLSGPDNEAKRDAIRATWAKFGSNIFIENGVMLYNWNHTWTKPNVQHSAIRVLFAIGTQGLNKIKLEKLLTENSRSQDLLLLDSYEDSYKNLVAKLLHSLQWITENYDYMKYLIKCDDDSFVRIDLIVRDLEAYAPDMDDPKIHKYVTAKRNITKYKGLYWGYFHGNAKVYISGKWEEKDWFLCDSYLPYALGGGYVISQSIVDYVVKNADILSQYHSEDVSMGVWTAALDGINRVHDIRFDTQWKSRGCDNTMIVRHKQTPSDMFQMYRTLVHSHGERLCKAENALRNYYFYNWNGLPSMCCK